MGLFVITPKGAKCRQFFDVLENKQVLQKSYLTKIGRVIHVGTNQVYHNLSQTA